VKLKDVKVYQDWKANNTDPYGMGIFRYAEAWALLMEAAIENGEPLQDVAKKLSHEADTEGITGYMYGAAVNILSQCWEHGEALRVWHNKDYGHEGDGVVNPAIITIQSND
jgi:hypothetical protein